MRLANPEWNNTLEWDYLHPGCLVLEDPDEYRAAVGDLSRQAQGEEGILVFSENGEICNVGKEGLLIRDLWAVDLNQKKLLNGVLKELTGIGQEEYYPDIFDVIGRCEELLNQITRDSMLPLEWNTPADLMPFLKSFGVQLETPEDPIDRLLDYVHLAQEILHIHFIVLVGIRSYLTDRDYFALCREFTASELSVLFVEPVSKKFTQQEKRLVIDADRCELRFP